MGTINKRSIKLRPSKNKKFPGWWTFPFHKVIYYIRFTTKGIRIVTLKNNKVVTSKVVSKPKRKKPTKGTKKPKKEKKPKTGKKKPTKGTKKPKGEKKPKTGKKKPTKGTKKPTKGTKKPTKKNPKKHPKKHPRKVTFFLRRFPGTWKFKFPKVSFKFVIKHKRITINKRPIKLRPSKNKKFPGWLTFPFHKVIYYVRFTTKGIRIVTLKNNKVVT